MHCLYEQIALHIYVATIERSFFSFVKILNALNNKSKKNLINYAHVNVVNAVHINTDQCVSCKRDES